MGLNYGPLLLDRHAMASRDLSRKQSSIVKRYYDNLDGIVANRLQEAVTELYLAESEKKCASLWKKVQVQLSKTAADPGVVHQIVEDGDVERLARLVNDLLAGKIEKRS